MGEEDGLGFNPRTLHRSMFGQLALITVLFVGFGVSAAFANIWKKAERSLWKRALLLLGSTDRDGRRFWVAIGA